MDPVFSSKLELFEDRAIHRWKEMLILIVTLPIFYIWIYFFSKEIWLISILVFWYLLIWAVGCCSGASHWEVDFFQESIRLLFDEFPDQNELILFKEIVEIHVRKGRFLRASYYYVDVIFDSSSKRKQTTMIMGPFLTSTLNDLWITRLQMAILYPKSQNHCMRSCKQ